MSHDSEPPRILKEGFPTPELCIERASRLVSPKYGVIDKVEFEDLEPGEPQVFFARTFPPKTNPLNNSLSINFGDAVSTDPNRALIKSIGECIERYSSAFVDKSLLVKESIDGLKKNFSEADPIDLETLTFFLPDQYNEPGFPFSPVLQDTVLHWVKCLSLGKGNQRWVPAQSVFVPFPNKEYGDPYFKDQISTGMACGPNKISSIYKGLLEIIERDSFMVHWLNRIPPPEVDLSSVKNPFAKELLETLEQLPVTAKMYSLALDIEAYIFLFVVENRSGVPPHTIMGLGADLDPERSLILALEETLLTFIGMGRYARAKPEFSPGPGFTNLTTPTLHALAHAICPDLKKSLGFLSSSPKKIKFEDLKPRANPADLHQGVDFLVKELEKQNLEPLYFDLTTEDIDHAGFKVARVIIPGMQPLDINHNQKHLGVNRYREVIQKLELTSSGNEINPFPHAFP